jgi:transposase
MVESALLWRDLSPDPWEFSNFAQYAQHFFKNGHNLGMELAQNQQIASDLPQGFRQPERKRELLELAQRTGSVSEACRLLGCSRDTYYRILKSYRLQGEDIFDSSSRIRNPRRLSEEIERAVIEYSQKRPSYGRERVSRELSRLGIRVSPSAIRNIWMRHGLSTLRGRVTVTPEPTTSKVVTRPRPLYFDERPFPMLVSDLGQLTLAVVIERSSRFALTRLSAKTASDLTFSSLERRAIEFFRAYGGISEINRVPGGAVIAEFWEALESELLPVLRQHQQELNYRELSQRVSAWCYYHNYERMLGLKQGKATTPWESLTRE